MTVEELSSATASRYESKMLHDVKSSTRVRSPPRPDPPMFGRESMEDAVSARATVRDFEEETEDPIETPSSNTSPNSAANETAVSAKAVSVEDEMEAFFSLFQRVEPQLHSFLSDADKKRIRRALRPPSTNTLVSGNDQAMLTIGVSILLTALVFYVCRPASPQTPYRMGYRSTGEKASVPSAHATNHSSRRDSVVSWNIGRLLKPLNDARDRT